MYYASRNYAGGNNNGGAIRAMGHNSKVEVEYSKFGNNEGFIGGAIYTVGDLRILQTEFTDNISPVAVRTLLMFALTGHVSALGKMFSVEYHE